MTLAADEVRERVLICLEAAARPISRSFLADGAVKGRTGVLYGAVAELMALGLIKEVEPEGLSKRVVWYMLTARGHRVAMQVNDFREAHKPVDIHALFRHLTTQRGKVNASRK